MAYKTQVRRADLRNKVITRGKLSDSVTFGGGGGFVSLVVIFRDSASLPPTPTGGSYDRDSSTLTPPSGWTADRLQTVASTLYISYGAVSSDDTIQWTKPIKETRQTPFDFSDFRIRMIFRQSPDVPDLPTTATYNEGAANGGFGTTLGDWTITRPDSDAVLVGNQVYQSLGLVDITAQEVQWANPTTVSYADNISSSVPKLVAGRAYEEGDVFWQDGEKCLELMQEDTLRLLILQCLCLEATL